MQGKKRRIRKSAPGQAIVYVSKAERRGWFLYLDCGHCVHVDNGDWSAGDPYPCPSCGRSE